MKRLSTARVFDEAVQHESNDIECGTKGLRLGPAALVSLSRDAIGRPVYSTVSSEALAEILFAAYGSEFQMELPYRAADLRAIAKALTEGHLTRAMIGAAHLRLPAIPPDGFLRLQRLAKYSSDQPRVPVGNPDGGQWTRDGSGAVGADQAGIREEVAGRVDSLSHCIDRCWQILERPKPYPSSDINEFDFRKCVNECRQEFQGGG